MPIQCNAKICWVAVLHFFQLEKDKELTKDAAEFLLLSQIPQLVKECLEHQVAPIDGLTITESLHQRGINIRYLGKFTKLLEEHVQLAYLHVS
jgi:protein TIF31